MKKSVWVVLAVIFMGCAAASPPVESAESDAGKCWPSTCEAETSILYLQLGMWRYDAAACAAREETDAEAKQAILEEARVDVYRLRQEYSAWDAERPAPPADAPDVYCGVICQEVQTRLFGVEMTEAHNLCTP
jgi:hypothetical protein